MKTILMKTYYYIARIISCFLSLSFNKKNGAFLFILIYINHFSNSAFSQIKNPKFDISKIKSTSSIPSIKTDEKELKKNANRTLNGIWFEKNEGQFGNKAVLYGFRTSFGSMGVYKNKLRLVTEQRECGKVIGHQIVDIKFPGANSKWGVLPGSKSSISGSYNNSNGCINAKIYNEIILKNVYNGIDLKLYTGENATLEFDWMVKKATDYKKIRMKFIGQDGISIDKESAIVIKMRQEDLKIIIPETYQIINGKKNTYATKICIANNNETLKYEIAGNFNPAKELVIDPVMTWSTYMHNNTSTFDEYLYAISANKLNEVYACGLTSEAISTAYMSGVAPGFSNSFVYALNASKKKQSVILYRLNATGTAITAWTYTGQTSNIPVALGVFPDNRVLVVYKMDTVQIFSANLATRHYNGIISANLGKNVLSYQSQAIISNDIFYLGGIAETALSTGIIPVTAPDATIAGMEGVILRINTASTTPTAEWGTYVGGSANESFTAIAATPDNTKIAFAVHVDGTGNGYPALVNAVDITISGTELLVGVIPVGLPTAFSVFSYLGGSANEGISTSKSNAALVAADNNYFYVAGNTLSTDLPGTNGAAQPQHGANATLSDQFLSQIPLNGSAVAGFITTYNGGSKGDIVGGLVIDLRTSDVLLFGTSESTDFPVYNSVTYSPFYQATHGNTTNGLLDITYTVFANGLQSKKYATYIGGDYNDYLGSTGKLEGTGHFHYNKWNGLTYIGTTIHSDQTSIPPQWMTDIPGFDKSIPLASTSKDNHFIFAMNPNSNDYGDAPASYDGLNPARSAVAAHKIRIGLEIDAEEKPNSSLTANGDDIQNFGSGNDEDGIVSLPSMALGDNSLLATISVFNNSGSSVYLYGWVDTDGNGEFDATEFTSVLVPTSTQQQIVQLNFTNLPPFESNKGYTFLRLRITNVPLSPEDARGDFGMGEVEDHLVLRSVILNTSLLQFSVKPQPASILLNWTIANEANITNYIVEHSTDNINFYNIGNTSNSYKNQYSLVHSNPANGVNYYRLKIFYADGNFMYSVMQQINFGKLPVIKTFPNPAKEFINISIAAAYLNKAATLQLFSADGKLMKQKTTNSLNQTETIDLINLSEGHYILKIETGNESLVKQIVIKK